MSTDDFSTGDVPGLTREQKDVLSKKLTYLEDLETLLAAGEIKGEDADAELIKTLAEVEAIMEDGRKQAELEKELAHLQELEKNLASGEVDSFQLEELLGTPTKLTPTDPADLATTAKVSSLDNSKAAPVKEQSLEALPRLSHSKVHKNSTAVEAKTLEAKEEALARLSASKVEEQNDGPTPDSQKKDDEALKENPKTFKTKTNTDQGNGGRKGHKTKSKGKTKLRVPTKIPRAQQKKKFPVGILFFLILLGAGGFYHQQIIDFIKKMQDEVAYKAPPEKVRKKPVYKEQPKVEPKFEPKKLEAQKEEPKVIEKEINFFQPEEGDTFKGELKHYSFNQVLKDKCISCHGAEGKEVGGDFNIARLMKSSGVNAKYWAKIYRAIDKGEMPPPVEDEPESVELEAEEKELLLASIKTMHQNLKEGMTTRVLTPYEIQNTLGDLFEIDYSQYNPLLRIHQSYSENSFYTHQRKILSPHYLSDYYNILYDILQSFIGLRPQVDPLNLKTSFRQVGAVHYTFKDESHLRWHIASKLVTLNFKGLSEKKETKQDRYLDGNNNQIVNSVLAAKSIPPGTYTLRFKASCENMSMTNITTEKYGEKIVKHYEKFFEDNVNLVMPVKFCLEPPGVADPFARRKYLETIEISSEGEYAIQFEVTRRSGVALHLDVPGIMGQGHLARNIGYHRHGEQLELKQLEAISAELGKKEYDFPMVKFSDVRLEGPYDVKLNPLSFDERTKINDTEVREKFKYLHSFNGMKLSVIYTYMFRDLRKEKMKMEDAYRNTLITFFMSSKFLIVNSAAKALDDKLRFYSYAIHKSPPSDEFRQVYTAALKQKNHKALGKWLVGHDHFRRFSNAFTYQWLKLGEIKNNLPDEGKFREYYRKDYADLQQKEAEMFIMNMFRKNRPITDLVNADYTFVDKDLMDFYGIQSDIAPYSGEFTLLKTGQSGRGGILSMGAFLTATGNGVDPLPLRRAAWISENILDSPLPSPPDVDVTDFEKTMSGKTLRERLEVHAQNPACHSCHKRLDSLAIIMDKYDSIGHYNHDYSTDPVKINDQKITNVEGLKGYLSQYSKPMARAFSKKLISFMLGREAGVQDEAKLDEILKATEAEGYRTGDLYAEILKHYFL